MITFRPLVFPTFATVLGLAVLIGLGVWQLQRLEWKQSLISTIESRINGAPEPLDSVLASQDLSEVEWRPVSVTGRFLHDREVYLYATEFDLGPGVHVVTPLERADGSTVLIDRGWVSNQMMDPATRSEGQVDGPVEVTGIVRLTAPPNPYVRESDPAKRLWYTRNPAAMAEMAGVKVGAPIVVAAGENSVVPGGPRFPGWRFNLPNRHLEYALTWFGLAFALGAVYLVYHYSQGRLSFGSRHARQ